MCGMIAAVGWASEGICSEGIQMMEHRGKRQGIVSGGFWAIGHRRLPIVGLGYENDQPVHQGRWTIAFVGEILNYKELGTLTMKWSEGDLGTVVSEWVCEGPPGFRKFDGFWAVVAYDHEKGEMHCLVDYLAQKPMYMRHGVKNGTWFGAVASEINPLAAIESDKLNRTYLSSCIKWGYDPTPSSTPYESIIKISPGMHIIFNERGVSSMEQVDHIGGKAVPFSADQLKAEIKAAVKRRVLSSDVPVACLASGGLDSSIVYSLAQRDGDVNAYATDVGIDEEGLKRVLAGGKPVNMIPPSPVSMERAVYYMQEPIDLGSLIPQVILSDGIAAAWGENVCLTGDGADELFGGYPRSMRYDSQWSDVFCELVRWHLPRLDRVMMRNAIEVRSPFLARRVVQMALSLPRDQRVGKKILRELFKDDLPSGVAEIPKVPLKSSVIAKDREANSVNLVNLFIEMNPYYRK